MPLHVLASTWRRRLESELAGTFRNVLSQSEHEMQNADPAAELEKIMALLAPLCSAAIAFAPPAQHGRVLVAAASSARISHIAALDSERTYGPLLAGPFEFGFPLRAPDRATVRRE